MVHIKNKHKCTMQGLQKWFEMKFEKLGWMALAKAHGHDLLVRSYLQSIDHLSDCISYKIKTVQDPDRKEDLNIMCDHVDTLCKAADKLLKSDIRECTTHKKHHEVREHDVTFHGLHMWQKKMFERLGWMVLAKNEGNSLKIKAYRESICRLKHSLMNKMNDVEEKDRKDDLKILYDDVCILCSVADKVLGKWEGSGKMSSSTTATTPKPTMKKSQKKIKKMSKRTKKTRSGSGSVFGGLF